MYLEEPAPPTDQAVLSALMADPEPTWIDKQMIVRAQAFWHDHLALYSGALFALLIHGFAINRFSDVLVQAGYAKNPWTTHVRFRDTGAAVHLWMTTDVTDPQSAGRRSLQQVRWMHAFARNVVQLPGGLWEREEEVEKQRLAKNGETVDASKRYLGVPLSQFDLAITLLGFSTVAMSYMVEDYGVELTSQNREDLTHFWRYIGYHLGIHEAYNSCASSIEAEQMANEMFNFSPIFSRGARDSTLLLSQSLMKGFAMHTGVPNSVLVALPVIVGENRSWCLDVLRPKGKYEVAKTPSGKPSTIPHNLIAKRIVKLIHRMQFYFPVVRTFMNAFVRYALMLMCRHPRVATFIEANVLPVVVIPMESGFRVLEVIYAVIQKSNLFKQVLMSTN